MELFYSLTFSVITSVFSTSSKISSSSSSKSLVASFTNVPKVPGHYQYFQNSLHMYMYFYICIFFKSYLIWALPKYFVKWRPWKSLNGINPSTCLLSKHLIMFFLNKTPCVQNLWLMLTWTWILGRTKAFWKVQNETWNHFWLMCNIQILQKHHCNFGWHWKIVLTFLQQTFHFFFQEKQ